MNRLAVSILGGLFTLTFALASTGCASGSQPAATSGTPTRQTSSALTTSGQPPPAHVVSTTHITSSEVVPADRPQNRPVVVANDPGAEGAERGDRRVSERIASALGREPTLKDVALDRVRVTTIGKKVTLAGLVPTLADSMMIETRVREVRGVEAVDNMLQILR